jgi:hypothetical protein
LQGVQRFPDGELDASLPGGKHNLTDIAARIGIGQLARLEEFNARRRLLARRYFERFDRSLGCELPVEDFSNSNWHMFQIVLPNSVKRGDFIRAMHAEGIGIGVHYPAIHLLTFYRQMGFEPGDFPIAEHIGAGIVTLPLFPAMKDEDVDRVCTQTARVIRHLSAASRPSNAAVASRG